jgi:formylglycine-generating enzyme required for sulfatase activity
MCCCLRKNKDFGLTFVVFLNIIFKLHFNKLANQTKIMLRTLISFFLFLPSLLNANNIDVDNISLTDQDAGLNTIMLNFDLSWENSWRVSAGPSNWDAAWVFAKYRTPGGEWKHVEINFVDGTNDGHIAPAGATIKTVDAGIGCFIHRDTEGAGNIDFSNVKLLWDYGLEGLVDDSSIEIKVFAIEMVYVPSGSFSVGSGELTETHTFYKAPTIIPFEINSEAAITVGLMSGNLYYNSAGSGGDQAGPIPASFPKGFDAYYCMKYEMSQGQWVAFFNTLTDTQKANNDLTDVNHKNNDAIVDRNGISWGSGYATTSLPDVPNNYYDWSDMTAYLDWAGLRPMTELEFEKSCRGPLTPVKGEFAWGNAEIPFGPEYTFLNFGTSSEVISNPQEEQAGVAFNSTTGFVQGPIRCGIHAASAINKTRTETGGSYYGIMELSGNVTERCITVGSADSRAYSGNHGDGELDVNGENNVINWPAGNTGSSYRGGDFIDNTSSLRVSHRSGGAVMNDLISWEIGIRGVRTE